MKWGATKKNFLSLFFFLFATESRFHLGFFGNAHAQNKIFVERNHLLALLLTSEHARARAQSMATRQVRRRRRRRLMYTQVQVQVQVSAHA